mmetsp:Transcript_13729/g.13791  ORF Transcript_13729/g.13791 Transcript_13729/m.13791 type:complete len:232 (+) Transcript_13729:114-809(+)|eukprot:CAMPEP_0182416824 /NCGR_PEP_ID=MMETSP1167-20130531/1194_1 /TAXON_ID=2988 /ORGANISM="Mallomonas Sp, Strain CCMP3275" /LENGTH=231 /DNA_ID=CAMNT_0024589923 /DNA_START=97 /DNA_END=792 /DNA_ORIENTATION=-
MPTGSMPTFHPALGGGNNSSLGNASRQVSVKDQPGQTKIKYRQSGQSTEEDMRMKNLRAELDEREKAHIASKKSALAMIEQEEKSVDVVKLITNGEKPDLKAIASKYNDADVDGGESDKDFDSSDDSDTDSDDEEELQRELLRIKSERAAAAMKREEEEREEREREKTEGVMRGNPLMDLEGSGTAKIKRKWNDDVVFRHQTRGETEMKKRFVNDTIRSDFHRSFLKKYVH